MATEYKVELKSFTHDINPTETAVSGNTVEERLEDYLNIEAGDDWLLEGVQLLWTKAGSTAYQIILSKTVP